MLFLLNPLLEVGSFRRSFDVSCCKYFRHERMFNRSIMLSKIDFWRRTGVAQEITNDSTKDFFKDPIQKSV